MRKKNLFQIENGKTSSWSRLGSLNGTIYWINRPIALRGALHFVRAHRSISCDKISMPNSNVLITYKTLYILKKLKKKSHFVSKKSTSLKFSMNNFQDVAKINSSHVNNCTRYGKLNFGTNVWCSLSNATTL